MFLIYLQDNFDVKDVAEAHQIVVDKVQGISITEEVYWGDTVYCGLVKYFQNHATTAENIQFVKKTFPSIIDLGLEVEALLPTDGIDINEQQKGMGDCYNTVKRNQITSCLIKGLPKKTPKKLHYA